ARRARREVLERIEVRLRGVVDVGGVDAVAAVADEAQAPGLRAFDQARQDLLVARAPDQARAQRDRRQARAAGQLAAVRRQHFLFRDGLGDRKSTRLNSSHVKISYA